MVVSPSEQGSQPWLSFRPERLNEGDNKGSVVDRGSGSGDAGGGDGAGGIGGGGLQSHQQSARDKLSLAVYPRARVWA